MTVPAPPALILFAHGSRVAEANASVVAVASQLDGLGLYSAVVAAFLELAEPSLAAAAARLVGQGASRVVVVPYFLTLGIHLQRDLPAMVEEIRSAHPRLAVQVTPPLDGHPALLQAVEDRARQALTQETAA